MSPQQKRFKIALSFSGEHRSFVEQVAALLAERVGRERVLYDKYHEHEFARPNLDVYLPNLYRTQSELIGIFLCAEFVKKRWPNLEWRFIRDLIATSEQDRIMFLSFDDLGDASNLGILRGDGYLPIGARSPEEIAQLIFKRLGGRGSVITRFEVFSDRPLDRFDESEFMDALRRVIGADVLKVRITSIRQGSTVVELQGDSEVLRTIIARFQESQATLDSFARATGMTSISWTTNGRRYELVVNSAPARPANLHFTEQPRETETRVRVTHSAEPREHGTVVRKVIVELDLVSYSTICEDLEQGLDVNSAFQLNRQIQTFIDAGLKEVNLPRDKTVMATTGDGAILVFDSSQEAHRFAQAVHQATCEHNRTRTQPMAKRLFRMGAATGEIVMEAKPGGGFDIAGGTIARAVRLEGNAKPGGLLIDEATYESLSPGQQSRYGAMQRVPGKHNEEFEAYGCLLNPDGPKDAAFFTRHARQEPAPQIAPKGFGRDQRREVLALFKQLKSHQYTQLIFLLEMPIGQRPPDTLNLDEKMNRILQWADESSRLDWLSEVLGELTEPETHSAFRQELKRVADDRVPIDERRSAAQRMADDFSPDVQSAFVDAIGKIYPAQLDPTVKSRLARAMGESRDQKAVGWLQRWLPSAGHPLVTMEIKEALQKLGLVLLLIVACGLFSGSTPSMKPPKNSPPTSDHGGLS